MKNNLPRLSIFNADHEGNTRLVFDAAPANALTKTASMESATNSDFQNYPTGGSRNSLSLYNHTTGGTYSQLLNGGNNSQIGVAKSYKVYPGDKVKINAYAKYANLTGNTSNVSAFASALLNTFLLPAPLAGEAGTASRALNDWGSIVAVGGDGQSNAAPRVSVNIIVFDKNYNFLDAAFDQIDPAAEQVGITPVVAHDLLSKEYTVKEEGYVFMYIANENQTQVDAYFDDVAMTYTPTNIVQYNEYYPFGLQASTSWTRENNTNNFLYNAGSELNVDAGWYETMFRGYDATLGRFMQVDPLAYMTNNMSSYQYANNSPSLRNDPLGLKSPAPPGVSQMGWDRIQKNADRENGSFNMDDWADSFGGYDYYAGAVAPFANFWNSLWSNTFKSMENSGTDLVDYGRNDYGELGVWIQYGLDGEAGVGAYFHKVDENSQGSSYFGGGVTTAAAGVLAFISTDIGIPEPTDAFWPKWAVYAAAGTIAGAIVYSNTTSQTKTAQSGVQYSLRARTSGLYPTMTWGSQIPGALVYLNAGEVWKIGETIQYDAASQQQYRYTQTQLNAWNVNFIPEFTGSQMAIKTMEGIKIIGYVTVNGTLPPGNKGFK